MGNTINRTKLEATVPIAQISIKLLTYQPIQSNVAKTPNVDIYPKFKSVGSKPFKIPIVTPWLCGSLLKNSKSDLMCTTKDVEDLKDYLASESNISKYDISKQRFRRPALSKRSELEQYQRQQEQEIVRILDTEKFPHKTLSNTTHKYLKATLKQLDSKLVASPFSIIITYIKRQRKPELLTNIVLPQLEKAYSINQNRSAFSRILIYTILEKYGEIKIKFIDTFIRHQLSPSILRRNPSIKLPDGIPTVPGVDRAHKLSLQLAVQLWIQIYGHDLAYNNVKDQVREALAMSSNIYHTCHHTNRVLHVKFDKEIIDALQKPRQESACLTPGAKMRLRQIIEVLYKLEQHSEVMKDFSKRSVAILKRLK